MKRIFTIIAALLALILVACEKETVLTIDQTSLSFTDTGGSQTISLTANKPWSVKCDQSWCKVSPSSGEEAVSSKISISCDANTSYDARNCIVTFTCAELTKTVSISQATNNGLLVSQTSYELTKAAQQLNIQVQANVKFSVEVDAGCKDWITYKTTKGLTTNTVVLDIAENNSYDSREGKVTIKQDGGNLSSTVVIKQGQTNGLFLTTSEYNLSNENHTLTVEVKSNIDFEVKSEADWIKYVETKGLKTNQIVLDVEANETYDTREGKVTVKQKNGDLTGSITVRQDQNYGILVSQSEYNLTNEAQTIDVEIKYNVDFDVIIPDGCKDWISIVGTKGLSTRTYTFSVAKNESYDNRECSITFKQKNGSLSGTVLIKQSQTDGLIAEKTEYKITAEKQTLDIKIKSNVSYEVVIDDACKDWLSLVQTKGLTESIVSLFVAKNEGNTRKGRVYLNSEGIQEEITIVQDAEGYVEFEDANFKAYCVEYFDNNKDGKISYTEAFVVEEIVAMNRNIASLEGIKYFINLRSLLCQSNQLNALDVSNNTALVGLYCGGNQLTALDVSHNTALTSLNCAGNQLTSLDVSNNTALVGLYCGGNQLTALDVSNNTALRGLSCKSNQLTTLDVSNNSALNSLNCDHNQLTTLDVSNNTALAELRCESNQLTTLDLSNNTALVELYCYNDQLTTLDVSNCTALQRLDCQNNQLTTLDVNRNTALGMLWCYNNQLTSLDVSNNAALVQLLCYDNPYLKEIWLREGQTISVFRYDTGVATIKYKEDNIEIPDAKFRAYLLSNFDTNHDGKLSNAEAQLVTSIDVSNMLFIASLDGIEYFKNLEYLDCSINQLTTLDLSHNTALSQLYCDANQLTALEVSHNTALLFLSCGSNKLTNLDVSNNTALDVLRCYRNQLTALDVSNNTALTSLDCWGNQLSILNISNNAALEVLKCWSNKLTNLDVSNNTALTRLSCWDNQLTALEVSHNTALTWLTCDNNKLTSLDLSHNTTLELLQCYNNQLSSLDVSNNSALYQLLCYDNPYLTEIWLKTGQTITDFQYDTNIATIYYKD